jgi:hypothetical protein
MNCKKVRNKERKRESIKKHRGRRKKDAELKDNPGRKKGRDEQRERKENMYAILTRCTVHLIKQYFFVFFNNAIYSVYQ